MVYFISHNFSWNMCRPVRDFRIIRLRILPTAYFISRPRIEMPIMIMTFTYVCASVLYSYLICIYGIISLCFYVLTSYALILLCQEWRNKDVPLQWRHNGLDGVSNHQPHDCLLNCLFRHKSKKTSKLRVNGLCAWNSPVNSPHKRPVTPKMFPFDDAIMQAMNSISHP